MEAPKHMGKQRAWRLIPVVLLAGGALLAPRQHQGGGRGTRPPARPQRPAETAQAGQRGGALAWRPAAADAARLAAVARLAVATQPVRLRPAEVLVTLNRAPIRAEDVLAFGPGQAQTIAPESYRLLLDRAIERELVRQAAREQGVALTEPQQQQLQRLRAERLRQVAEGKPDLVAPHRLELDLRQLESQMLLGALLAKAGAPAPYPAQADVDRFYREHQEDYEELPDDPARRGAALQKIGTDIRQILSREMHAAYQEQVARYLEQLKARADLSSG